MPRKNRTDPTPEELVELEKKAIEAEKVWHEYLQTKDKKPDWMIDKNSSLGEVLEFTAYTLPFKHQQIIEMYEAHAKSLSDLAEIFDDQPEEKEKWLNIAEDCRKKAEEMRQKNWMYRLVSENAIEELDEVR